MNFVDLPSAKTEIADRLGYFPAFLTPAIQFPAIFRSLVQQTLFSYKQNPLPVLFKEKLFVYLSHYYGVSYFTICHSCELRSLDVTGLEILSLAKIEFPQTEVDIQADLKLLRSRIKKDTQSAKEIETSLLRCASFVFAHPSESARCGQSLERILGTVSYNYLLILLGYIKQCHQWVNSNPSIDHKQDIRSQLHLNSLLLSQIELACFFQTQEFQKENPESIQQGKQRLTLFFSSQLKLATEDNSILKLKLETFKTFASYLENLPFPVMICNDSEEIIFLNHSWLETTGYKTSEISTLDDWFQKARVTINHNQSEKVSLSSLNSRSKSAMMPIERYALQLKKIATETKTTLQRIIDSLMVMAIGMAQNCGDEISQEVSIITKKGIKRFWQLHSSTLVYDYGDRELTISIAKDITDIHQANLKLRLISEATKTSTWSWNLENNEISLGYCGHNILGLNDFDGSYASLLSSVHPDERESVDLSIVRAIQTKEDLNLEYRVIKPNQDNSWIKLQGKLNYDSQGKAIELEGVVTDITQYQNFPQKTKTVTKRESTKESCPQLETIFELIPNYTFVVDVDHNISYINTALVRGFNLSSVAQVKGKKISECFPPDYVRQIAWLHQQVLTSGEVLRIQEEATLSDGVHYLNTVITPIKNDRGEVEALLHTSNDIPNLAATQEALSDRTIQLEAANRELESFSYSVSHDLQAPLRIINGFSQVLWETCQPDLDDRGKHFIERIQANSQKMSDLIDALLELSRVTRSQMKLVDVNLSDIARDVIEELQAGDSQRQVKISIVPNLQTKGDPQLLRIMLNNLLNNAWKYTSKRSPAKIEFGVVSNRDTETIYYIRDNGAGFDREYVDKLFTAFQRLHSQIEFPGTGIGLATVQRIIYRHGGKVWAEGEIDRGATIYFSL